MHAHEQARARADGGLVVLGVGAVGGADFDQLDPGARHDVGNAEGTADLDQLATGNDAFLARPQAVQCQQHGGGIVVDHGDGLGARQLANQTDDQVVAVTALAAGQVELEVEWVARGLGDGVDGLLG